MNCNVFQKWINCWRLMISQRIWLSTELNAENKFMFSSILFFSYHIILRFYFRPSFSLRMLFLQTFLHVILIVTGPIWVHRFRKLFVTFSSYTYMNTLRKIAHWVPKWVTVYLLRIKVGTVSMVSALGGDATCIIDWSWIRAKTMFSSRPREEEVHYARL